MVSLILNDVGLEYRLQRFPSLAPREKRQQIGGRILGEGRNRHVTALEQVSFSLAAGDRLGLVGSNGAGKTTLLKVLFGIFEPTTGTIERHGRVDALFNISLGFRAQATGRRNIELRALINGWSKANIDSHMDEIIEFSELGEFIDMPIKLYSQGMAARLAFTVATTLEPEILLMDEWIGAGDPSFQEKARARMQLLSERAGIIVLASHNHGLLKKTCNKILQLQNGRSVFFGTSDDFFAREEKVAAKSVV